jgi:hypothetical protein
VQPRHRGSRNGEEAAAGVDNGSEISKGQGGGRGVSRARETGNCSLFVWLVAGG